MQTITARVLIQSKTKLKKLYLAHDLSRDHDLSLGLEFLLERSHRRSGRWQRRLQSPEPLFSNLPTRKRGSSESDPSHWFFI